MKDEIIAIYCLCDDILKAMNHQEDSQQQISDAEVMITAIVATLYDSGNFEKGRKAMSQPQYIPNMISRSRFNRRLHRVEPMLLVLFEALGQAWKHLNTESVYSIDSGSIPVCDNIRMPRSKIYGGDEAYRGDQASKKRYFYGLKIHLMVTETGEPVEFFLLKGSLADVRGLRVFPFDLPVGSVVYADKAYNDYETEDLLLEAEHIQLSAMPKHNSKRPVAGYVQFLVAL
jgi:hypothetical protein